MASYQVSKAVHMSLRLHIMAIPPQSCQCPHPFPCSQACISKIHAVTVVNLSHVMTAVKLSHVMLSAAGLAARNRLPRGNFNGRKAWIMTAGKINSYDL